MCCENNNNNNNLSCQCLHDLLSDILALQSDDFKRCNISGCDRPFLGPDTNQVCYNTRPISFYNCTTGALWDIDFIFNGETGSSTVFRIESIEDCCCTCRILIRNTDDTYTATNQFFTINLDCVSAVRCWPDTFVSVC